MNQQYNKTIDSERKYKVKFINISEKFNEKFNKLNSRQAIFPKANKKINSTFGTKIQKEDLRQKVWFPDKGKILDLSGFFNETYNKLHSHQATNPVEKKEQSSNISKTSELIKPKENGTKFGRVELTVELEEITHSEKMSQVYQINQNYVQQF